MQYIHYTLCVLSAVLSKLLQSCLILCNPVDNSLPVSSVSGILQARILEWIAVPSSRGSSRLRDWIHISYISCIARQCHLGSSLFDMGQKKSGSGICLGDKGHRKESLKQGGTTSMRVSPPLTSQEYISCHLFNKSCLCELSWFVISIFHYDKTKTKEKEPHPKGNFPLKPIMTSINLVKYTL